MSKTIIPHPADMVGKTGDTLARHGREELPHQHSQIESLTSQGPVGLDYYVYIPSQRENIRAVMVSVHGLARNAAENMFRFARLAEKLNVCLIVPHFNRELHRYFQTLRPGKSGVASDIALNEVLDDVSARFSIETQQIYMFGFSGGGQFVHRYILCNPGRVKRAVLMAAGWYTMPDPNAPYPYGLADSDALYSHQVSLSSLLETPLNVMVGDRDIRRHRSLNKDPKIDSVQGLTRLDRAKTWVQEMKNAAREHQMPENISLHIIEGARHNFARNMNEYKLGELTMDYLFSNQQKGS